MYICVNDVHTAHVTIVPSLSLFSVLRSVPLLLERCVFPCAQPGDPASHQAVRSGESRDPEVRLVSNGKDLQFSAAALSPHGRPVQGGSGPCAGGRRAFGTGSCVRQLKKKE